MAERDIRVLLIDDEEELVEYLAKRLLREGFVVKVTNSGTEAVSTLEADDFDVAVVDLKMPGIDGIETQKRLKVLRPFLQTIVLTGQSSLDSALQSGKHDAFLFLEKPANHDQLVTGIRDAAERKNEILQAHFREEMEQITSSGGTPRQIMKRIENLREKYGIN